jgi:hypothetical protein
MIPFDLYTPASMQKKIKKNYTLDFYFQSLAENLQVDINICNGSHNLGLCVLPTP